MALPPAMPHICAPVIESGPGAAPLDSVGLNRLEEQSRTLGQLRRLGTAERTQLQVLLTD